MTTGMLIAAVGAGLLALIALWFASSLIELRRARQYVEAEAERLRMCRRMQPLMKVGTDMARTEELEYNARLSRYNEICYKLRNRVPAKLFGFAA